MPREELGMSARRTSLRARAPRVARSSDRSPWLGARSRAPEMESFGIRLSGGGTHQSKTMMLDELRLLLASNSRTGSGLKRAVVVDNVLGKATANTRALTYRHLSALYGFNNQPPLTRSFFALWGSHKEGRPLLALLISLARDPLLRDTAEIVINGAIGGSLKRPLFEAALADKHPSRFSPKMIRSLAQNCASTWTQAGHLKGAVKKVRQRVSPSPQVVAFAALLANASGFSGPAILNSMWIRVLDLSPGQALDLLRKAQGLGLARVRSVGDVTEISLRSHMAAMLKVPDLENNR